MQSRESILSSLALIFGATRHIWAKNEADSDEIRVILTTDTRQRFNQMAESKTLLLRSPLLTTER